MLRRALLTTTAGLTLVVLSSLNGNGAKTTSLRWNCIYVILVVVGCILIIVPYALQSSLRQEGSPPSISTLIKQIGQTEENVQRLLDDSILVNIVSPCEMVKTFSTFRRQSDMLLNNTCHAAHSTSPVIGTTHSYSRRYCLERAGTSVALTRNDRVSLYLLHDAHTNPALSPRFVWASSGLDESVIGQCCSRSVRLDSPDDRPANRCKP